LTHGVVSVVPPTMVSALFPTQTPSHHHCDNIMQETCCQSCSEDVKANFLTDSIYSQSYTHRPHEPSGFTGSKSSPYRRIANTDCGIEHAVTNGCHQRSSCMNCHLSRCVTETACLIIYVHSVLTYSPVTASFT